MSAALAKEVSLSRMVSLGRMVGPLKDPPCTNLHCSPLGTVPKADGTQRLIMHLSSPAVTNVNNGIFRDESSLTYITIDDAARMVAKYGR